MTDILVWVLGWFFFSYWTYARMGWVHKMIGILCYVPVLIGVIGGTLGFLGACFIAGDLSVTREVPIIGRFSCQFISFGGAYTSDSGRVSSFWSALGSSILI